MTLATAVLIYVTLAGVTFAGFVTLYAVVRLSGEDMGPEHRFPRWLVGVVLFSLVWPATWTQVARMLAADARDWRKGVPK